MSLNNKFYKLYGGLDYYDMVEISAKKLSDPDKQKIYSASAKRKECEKKQKDILKGLIGKEITKEQIKKAKTDTTKITNKTELDNIDNAKKDIREKLSEAGNKKLSEAENKKLSEAGNKNEELKFLDCTSGKLLKYLIRIELQNYKKCLIEQKKQQRQSKKSSKKGSSTVEIKDCKKEKFLQIVKMNNNNYFLNTDHILKLITDLLNSFNQIKNKLGPKKDDNITETTKNVTEQAKRDKKEGKKKKASFDIPKISQNELTAIIKETLNMSPPPIKDEEINNLNLGDRTQKGGGFNECYRIAKWCIFWGLITFIFGGFTLIFIGIMIAMSCGFIDLFTPNYNKKYQSTYDTAYNQAQSQQNRPQYQQEYQQNRPQYTQRQYNREYVGPNLNKAKYDLVRGTAIGVDKVATGFVNFFTPNNRFRGGNILGLSGGVDKKPKIDLKDKKVISIDALIEQINVAQNIFEKFKTDIEKIKENQVNNDIESNKVCAYNSDDTCFESRKNLNYIKKLLKSMDSVFDYSDQIQNTAAKENGFVEPSK